MSIRPGQAKGPYVGPSGGGAGTVIGAANIGAGTGLSYSALVAGILNFRTLLAGAGITITTAGDEITIATSCPCWQCAVVGFFDNSVYTPVIPEPPM
jgi:hypothetical protein